MTSLRENISVAWTAILANKMRSVLTMLGIIIGITAVITIVSIGSGTAKLNQDKMNNQGLANIDITVYAKEGTEITDDMQFVIDKELIQNVYDTYRDQIDSVSVMQNIGTIDQEWQSSYTKTKKASIITFFVFGNDGYFKTKHFTYLAGSPISETEFRNGTRVILLTESQAKILFGVADESCIGQTVETYFNNIYSEFTVKGIVKQVEDYRLNNNYTDPLTETSKKAPMSFIPVRAYEHLYGKPLDYDSCTVIPKAGSSSEEILALTDNITNDLNSQAASHITYSVYSLVDYIKSSGETVRMQFLVTALVAAIALLVGGIGVMNIMMVSITERTREIGTRKALGATNTSLLLQFITESILLCLIGGFIGIVLGIVFGLIATKAMQLPYVLEPLSIILSVVFSLLIGTFFGYYPASRAAKMDPIDALRYE